ncbi:hypothetical protein Cgig2_011182 [Carnegiea gigantea]|uniref:Uncharacterized protein n=1 Tax=Carnegiea gigantea TaxID=171969 RepID=A0A9Q1JL18_9CARY|nr:hypothetical protein Cgig2_011182 [Carnegiea gigantea]
MEGHLEVANLARPLPHFDYVPTTGCEPSHRRACIPSPHHTEREQEASRSNWSGQPYMGSHDRNADAATSPSGHPMWGQMAKFTAASTPYATHSRRTTWSILMEVRGHPMLWRPPPMTMPPKPHNARKYCEFHEQNMYTTAECYELKKALHELADKGQIDRFLKKGTCLLHGDREPAQP